MTATLLLPLGANSDTESKKSSNVKSVENVDKIINPTRSPIEPIKVSYTPLYELREAIVAAPVATVSLDNICVTAGKQFFPQSEWAIMAAVIQGESGGNPSAHNPAGYYGCFQVDNYPEYDPYINAKLAYDKFLSSQKRTGNGWRPWGVFNSGAYLKWM